jgi:hypothetical protein
MLPGGTILSRQSLTGFVIIHDASRLSINEGRVLVPWTGLPEHSRRTKCNNCSMSATGRDWSRENFGKNSCRSKNVRVCILDEYPTHIISETFESVNRYFFLTAVHSVR